MYEDVYVAMTGSDISQKGDSHRGVDFYGCGRCLMEIVLIKTLDLGRCFDRAQHASSTMKKFHAWIDGPQRKHHFPDPCRSIATY